jgi:hypothetical protein
MNAITAAIFLAMFLLVSHTSGRVEAYLDPGSGSIALQFLLGGVVATLAAVRLYWDRVKTFVQSRRVNEPTGDGR